MPEGEKEEQEIENLFENNERKHPSLIWQRKQTSSKSRKLRVPTKLDPRKYTPRHIVITLVKMKDKQRILKAAREKETVTYKGVPIRPSADFSKETLQARRDWQEVFKVMKSKDLQPR